MSSGAPTTFQTRLTRFAWGTVLALALVALGARWLTSGDLHALAQETADRTATVQVMAAGELAQRALGGEKSLPELFQSWSRAKSSDGASTVDSVRVVLLSSLSLAASTSAEDQGEKAAPRRLAREEKPLFDLGQRLRAAVETNREEGQSRKEELSIERLATGERILAAPLERDGAVVGLVQLKLRAPAAAPVKGGPGAWPFLGLGAGLLVLAVGGFAVGAANRRTPRGRGQQVAALGLLSLVALAASLLTTRELATRWLGREQALGEAGVKAALATEAAMVRSVLAEAGLEAAGLAPTGSTATEPWDVDLFRKPRAETSSSGGPASSGAAWIALGTLAFLVALFIGGGGPTKLWRTLVQHRQAYAYIAPAMLGMLVLVFFPFLYAITLSFTDASLYNSNKPLFEVWSGLANYKEILFDFGFAPQNFYWTLLFTIGWTISNVTIGVTVGLVLALILNTKGLLGRPLYRVLLILPWAVPNYITALIWKGLFHQQFGAVNQFLQLFGIKPLAWFDSAGTSFLTALATNGWLSFPFMMVVSLGALQSIPGELYEAATVDGASRWQRFRAITLPSLKPALVPAVILSVVWTFNMFNIIYLVTGGEPGGATEILVTQAYKYAFERYRYGYAAAYSTVIFGILLLYGQFQNRMSRASES